MQTYMIGKNNSKRDACIGRLVPHYGISDVGIFVFFVKFEEINDLLRVCFDKFYEKITNCDILLKNHVEKYKIVLMFTRKNNAI